jgi:5'-nucleotidase
MDSITAIGFDMDYTLVVYREEFAEFVYGLARQRLVERGYPASVLGLNYDSSFPMRGIILDKQTGCMLKTDNFGHVTVCTLGLKVLSKSEWHTWYPSGEVNMAQIGGRYYSFDTLYGLPEQCLYMQLVDLLSAGGGQVSFWNLFEDIRATIESLHHDGSVTPVLMASPHLYIDAKPEKLRQLLVQIRSAGKMTFILTNSAWNYTNVVMEYAMGTAKWRDYFDMVIVSASKPLFFTEKGTTLREVDTNTGNFQIASIVGSGYERGKVFSGGNVSQFMKSITLKNHEVCYVGDNLVHDLMSNRTNFSQWRTMFIAPELRKEYVAFRKCIPLLRKIIEYESLVRSAGEAFLRDSADLQEIREDAKRLVRRMEMEFNPVFGSIFRSGSSKLTFFAYQVQRFADIYGESVLSLLPYDLSSFFFMATTRRAAHEPWDWSSSFTSEST